MKKNNFIENCLIVISTLIITVITSVAIWSIVKTPDVFSQNYDDEADKYTGRIVNAFYPFSNAEAPTTLILNEERC